MLAHLKITLYNSSSILIISSPRSGCTQCAPCWPRSAAPSSRLCPSDLCPLLPADHSYRHCCHCRRNYPDHHHHSDCYRNFSMGGGWGGISYQARALRALGLLLGDRMAKIGFLDQKLKFWAQKKAVTFSNSPCSGHDRKKLFKEKSGLCPNNQGGKCHFG